MHASHGPPAGRVIETLCARENHNPVAGELALHSQLIIEHARQTIDRVDQHSVDRVAVLFDELDHASKLGAVESFRARAALHERLEDLGVVLLAVPMERGLLNLKAAAFLGLRLCAHSRVRDDLQSHSTLSLIAESIAAFASVYR
ncbi:MAG: hypothetical protein AAGF92_17775 [Myxococcota bacterium]